MNKYYYTFGSDPQFPYRYGHVVVKAESWKESHMKFRTRFPDRQGHEGIINCAFFYDESHWTPDPLLEPCWEVIE